MKKLIVYDNRVIKEFNKFEKNVRKDFVALVENLSSFGKLDFLKVNE